MPSHISDMCILYTVVCGVFVFKSLSAICVRWLFFHAFLLVFYMWVKAEVHILLIASIKWDCYTAQWLKCKSVLFWFFLYKWNVFILVTSFVCRVHYPNCSWLNSTVAPCYQQNTKGFLCNISSVSEGGWVIVIILSFMLLSHCFYNICFFKVEKLKMEVAKQTNQHQKKVKERAAEAKRIQDLERQVHMMGRAVSHILWAPLSWGGSCLALQCLFIQDFCLLGLLS